MLEFELFEQAIKVSLAIDHTLEFTYGDGCSCGCKWILSHIGSSQIYAHCKTPTQVKRAIAREAKAIAPAVQKHQRWLDKTRQLEIAFK